MAPSASQPRVERDDVMNHLRLLASFHRLCQESVEYARQSYGKCCPSKPIGSLAHRAAYRLELWLSIIGDRANVREVGPDELPPLDVALALHSMMLSPHRFFEDAQLRFPQLQRIKGYPFEIILPALSFEGPFYKTESVKSAAALWTTKTSLQYDPIKSLRVDMTRPVTCPSCDTVVVVPWHTDDNHGFADESFSQPCRCGMTLDRNTLCVAKFLDALSDYDSKGIPLPNTIEMTYGKFDDAPARKLSGLIRDTLYERHNNALPTAQQVLAHASDRQQTGIEYFTTLLESARLPLTSNHSIASTLLPFRHTYPFTQDIVDVINHIRYPLHSLNYEGLLPSAPGVDTDFEFTQSYRRYVQYLNKLQQYPGSHDGPPLRVDLVWHTHILKADTYRDDCIRLLGIIPNHVPRSELISSHDYKSPDVRIVEILEAQHFTFQNLANEYKEVDISVYQNYTDISGFVSDIRDCWTALKDHRPPVTPEFITAYPDIIFRLNHALPDCQNVPYP
ncbi:hypothetical protein ONZ45_g10006 [Pleurotus djamor]|nr:hypothetical protein ONZ45_g10006 [Pleurotus djamor]